VSTMRVPPMTWYVSRMGQVYGPIAIEHLRMWAQQGQLAPNDMVAPAGTAAWQPASSVPDLAPWFGGMGGRPARPTGVTAIAWIGVVLGALGVCGLAFSFAAIDSPAASSGPFAAPQFSRTYMIASGLMGVVNAALMVTSCAGLLGLREWARKLFFVFTAYAILFGLVDGAWALSESQEPIVISMVVVGILIRWGLVIAGSVYLTRPQIAKCFR
jgi:hypothetical protein